MKPKIHYVDPYIINPGEAVTIFLIGGGGTGSNVLSELAAINRSLLALDHPGIRVTLFDDDIVSESNPGRQKFYESDIGQSKANVLISRINRSYGFDWVAVNDRYVAKKGYSTANIFISCVDSVKSRMEIDEAIVVNCKSQYRSDEYNKFYWIDCGNAAKSGQIFIEALDAIKQPKSNEFETVNYFGKLIQNFKGIVDDPQEPTCSVAESLSKQDLMINKTIAVYCGHILWTMLREFRITHKGIYINLNTLITNPINL